MLHILPFAVVATAAAVVAAWLHHDWQTDTLRPRHAAWSLVVLAVLLASAVVSGWAFLAAAAGPA